MIEPPVDGDDLRNAMRSVPAQVVVVTARAGEELRGITIGSFTSVSLSPPLISFNVLRASRMYAIIAAADSFAVHLLASHQAGLSVHFARPDLDADGQFKPVKHTLDRRGIPILDGVSQVLQCRPHGLLDAGDHTIVVGRVFEILGVREGKPLLYYDTQYHTIGAVTEYEQPGLNGR